MSLPPFLEDDVVALRPLEPGDANGAYPGWLNDKETSKGNGHFRIPYSRGAARDYIDEINSNDSPHIALAIIWKQSGEHVGNIALQNICYATQSAKFAILIGESIGRGIGLGEHAGRLLINHAFVELNLRRIYCGTFEDNLAMQKLALKLGMQHVGTLRESVFKSGKFVDELLFDILRSDSA